MAAIARKPQLAPPSATGRIDAAQAALGEANRELAELTEKRNAALLKDDNAAAIELGVGIANLKLAARAHEDKIALLREQAAREEQARREKERETQIGKIEATIEQRDKAMDEVATAIKQLATASERAIKLSREVVAAWTWHAHDLPAALLTPPSIITSISHESYRLSYHPRRYGGMDTDPLAGSMLPGSRCPRLENMELPERTRPLVDVVRDASEFAKRFLRTGKGSATVEATETNVSVATNGQGEPLPRTEAEQKLGALLRRQHELSEDVSPQGEQEYRRIVSEIARVQDEITATKQMESQYGSI
jgi:hypothetical protein